MIVKCENIRKSYDSLEVLKGVDLSISAGEIVAIVGSSGAGKSTLLNILGTLDQPDSGLLEINHANPNSLNNTQLAKFRNEEVGFIFQFHHLLPEFTALENVCIPAFIKKTNRQEAENKAKNLLSLLGLEQRLTHKPAELSGGEQQRVAVARALINNPSIVLADEPSGNLDRSNSKNLYHMMNQLRNELGQTFLIVTHDEELANEADRKLQMVDGVIMKDTHYVATS